MPECIFWDFVVSLSRLHNVFPFPIKTSTLLYGANREMKDVSLPEV